MLCDLAPGSAMAPMAAPNSAGPSRPAQGAAFCKLVVPNGQGTRSARQTNLYCQRLGLLVERGQQLGVENAIEGLILDGVQLLDGQRLHGTQRLVAAVVQVKVAASEHLAHVLFDLLAFVQPGKGVIQQLDDTVIQMFEEQPAVWLHLREARESCSLEGVAPTSTTPGLKKMQYRKRHPDVLAAHDAISDSCSLNPQACCETGILSAW